MFDHTSRYYHLPDAVYTDAEGQAHHYKRRRLLPQSDSLPTQALLQAQPGDRLDLLALRGLANPELFWRLCDANDVLNPFDLLDQSTQTLRVPLPTVEP